MAHLKKPKRERNMVCCVLTDREREREKEEMYLGMKFTQIRT